MNLKLLVGIALFLIGLITAGIGMARVGDRAETESAVIVEENRSTNLQDFGYMAIPAIAGLCLAVGGLLIGLSMGNWKHPRTHLERGDQVVDPEGDHKMKHV